MEKTRLELEEVFSDPAYQLTGVAVSRSGRIFTNYPNWSDDYRYALVEITGRHSVKPYPNQTWNSWTPEEDGKDKWVCVQAVFIDDDDIMWVVDPASPKQAGVWRHGQKLVRIDLKTDKVERVYSLAGVTDDQSYANDVRVDTRRGIAYLTNSSEGGIIIVDLGSGKTRQVLQGHYSVRADPYYVFRPNGNPAIRDGARFQAHSDGIALTPDGSYLYYKPLTDDHLYRVKTRDLLDTSLSAFQLQARIVPLGKFTTTDGMTFDGNGNLYLGDLEKGRIMKVTPDLKMIELIQDDRLIWPDSYSVSRDGYLYISCSQIQKTPPFNDGKNMRKGPYCIYRIKLP